MDRTSSAPFILVMDVTNCVLDKSNDTCFQLVYRNTVKILKNVSDVEMPWKITTPINTMDY